MEARRNDIYDEEAARESYAALEAFSALGILSNPDDFHRVCEQYDKLFGYTSPLPPASDIINDKNRGWYLYLTAYVLRMSKLEIDEVVQVLDNLIEARTNKRTKKIDTIAKANAASNIILAFCRYCNFEPRWHMRRRGDDRPLPNTKDKRLWSFLRNLYTDPEYSRLRVPDNIRRVGAMYKGYDECLKRAIADGHAELKRIHGDNVDLSPVTEIRKHDENDFDGSSFMKLLNGGGSLFS